MGVFADVRPSDTAASELRFRRGVIISGGPGSVYEPGDPQVDPALFHVQVPVLGICYGHQLLAHHLGGQVHKGERGEYGIAHLSVTVPDPLWNGISGTQIWMSHRDSVEVMPPGFRIIACTENASVAAMSDPERRLFGLQFHPEVAHTHAGTRILENFLFDICGAVRDWDVSGRVPYLEDQIRAVAQDRNVFFFVSGGVDSTVAYTLCLRALGPERVYAIYVDTGLMRQGETQFVRDIFSELGATHFLVDHAEQQFLKALDRVYDPEAKRCVIGEEFVRVQERILATEHFLDGHWILGQGTIYPDTIESGGSAKADLIKTHHNRVAGIQALIESGGIIEPLSSFYKDEVREIGRSIGIPSRFLSRHPFPGPGLAIRCLCSATEDGATKSPDGTLLPVRSVGVQGDSRSYRQVLAVEQKPSLDLIVNVAPELTNRRADINRVVAVCGSKAQLDDMSVFCACVTKTRLDLLREADGIVRELCRETGFEDRVWQFPVVLLPLGIDGARESVVLRPINSVDGMTADVVLMPPDMLDRLTSELLALRGVAAVFYDVTHKPPGTIEWE